MLGILMGPSYGHAQPKRAAEEAWKPLTKQGGVAFSYLFYREATGYGSEGNGVVVKLVNTNDYGVRYRFKIVFRGGGEEHVEVVEGTLEAGEARTGSEAGLFWIPFADRRSIAEIGLRGYEIHPLTR